MGAERWRRARSWPFSRDLVCDSARSRTDELSVFERVSRRRERLARSVEAGLAVCEMPERS